MKLNKTAKMLESPPFYIVLGVVGILLISLNVHHLVSSLEEIRASRIEEKYLDLKPVNPSSEAWGNAIVSKSISSDSELSWRTKRTFESIYPAPCHQREFPEYLTGIFYGEGENGKTIVHTVLPGSSGKYLSDAKKALNLCGVKFSEKVIEEQPVLQIGGDQVIVFVGDSAVRLKIDNSTHDLQKIVSKLKDSILESGCVSTDVGEEEYKGGLTSYKIEKTTERVYTNINYRDFDFKQSPALLELYESPSIPEAPLPSGFNLPKTVEKPSFKTLEIPENIYSEANFFKVDAFGPGCGWNWGGFQRPAIDQKDFLKMGERERASALEDANSKALSFLKGAKSDSDFNNKQLPKAENWNSYVRDTNGIYEKWSSLNLDREKIKDSWNRWVESYRIWRDWDYIVDVAKRDYDEQVAYCKEKENEILSWERETLDGRTRDYYALSRCAKPPVKPFILDSSKPEEPSAFYPPKGVTIPHSWISSRDKKISEEEARWIYENY